MCPIRAVLSDRPTHDLSFMSYFLSEHSASRTNDSSGQFIGSLWAERPAVVPVVARS